MIKKNFITAVALIALVSFMSCSDKDKFVVEKGKVGKITKETTIKELKEIFKKDSISSKMSGSVSEDDYFKEEDEYFIFEKGGKLLLTITPKEQQDSLSLIKSIEIHDQRFATKNGINLASTFAEINTNYRLRVESTLLSVTLFLDELNATMTVDKEELGLKDFTIQQVSLEQIPDLAKIKSFVIWFD
ncbi:hypothetical protein [Polaribacter gangjinensis]|uniref:Uncharacterized protein n=1 Tax=Polaribacter gangjinensis TaxID=574710 RepID=A0A2S7W902_9FLAO|nr:hypothetical protein [Polaribacter gangjinensis]PQJ74097.1 hypothetical protein BTO13_01875 [Polaribacter gangjinensis]